MVNARGLTSAFGVLALLAQGLVSDARGASKLYGPETRSLGTSLQSGATRPNILLIVVDDWGTDKSGLYSEFNEDEIAIPTPTIDQIATEGVRFANAWGSPNCSPTRATLVTGQYPARNGVEDVIEAEGAVGIDTSDPRLLSHRLRNAGYRTGMIGKWHLTSKSDNTDNDAPLAAGFDFWTGTNGSFGPDADNFPFTNPAYYVTPPIQCDFRLAPPSCAEAKDWMTALEYQSETELTDELRSQYQPTYHVDQALGWINGQASDRPWFLYLAFQSPHAPFVLPPKHLLSDELIAEVEAKIRDFGQAPDYQYTEGQRFLSFAVTGPAASPGEPPPTQRLPNTSLARAAYAAMVAAVDTEISRLLGGIDLQNTFIILLGDNGTSGDVMDEDRPGFPAADAYLRGKGTLFQGGIAIPLVVSGPGIAERGRVSASLVHSSDVYSTILDMTGISTDRDSSRTDGISFMEVLRNPASGVGRRLVSWSDYGPNPPANSRDNPNDGPWGYAIRDDRYKLKSDAVYEPTGTVECALELPPGKVCRIWGWGTESSFYDLLNDPTEQENLLANGEEELSSRGRARLNWLRLQEQWLLESFARTRLPPRPLNP